MCACEWTYIALIPSPPPNIGDYRKSFSWLISLTQKWYQGVSQKLKIAPILAHRITARPEKWGKPRPKCSRTSPSACMQFRGVLLIVSIHWLTMMRSSPAEKMPKLAILTGLEFHDFPAATVIKVHHWDYQICTGGQLSSTVTCSERRTYSK